MSSHFLEVAVLRIGLLARARIGFSARLMLLSVFRTWNLELEICVGLWRHTDLFHATASALQEKMLDPALYLDLRQSIPVRDEGRVQSQRRI